MICEQYCKKVSLVDQADDLEMSLFSGANTVGITAGASTPSWIIKEVNNKMSEELKLKLHRRRILPSFSSSPSKL